MTEAVIRNVRIVTPNGIVEGGTVAMERGRILSLKGAGLVRGRNTRVVDGHGCWLLPGLIDLHNDGIELEIEPRPRAVFPLTVALRSMENRLVSHGITTIFHSFSFLDGREGTLAPEKLEAAIRELCRLRESAAIRHLVHTRYEIGEVQHYWRIRRLIEDGCVGLVSVMNHTPGQGQFRNLDNFINYYKRKHHVSPLDLRELMADRIEKSRSDAVAKNVRSLIHDARLANLPVASHDDDSPEKVAEMHDLGATIVEFPVELSAAVAAAARGMHVVVGAPNVLRGTSTSGNLKAQDAISVNAAHVICSDYYCPAMLHAVFGLYHSGTLSLPDAVGMASLNAARAVGLDGDLGSIEPGKRADLILVEEIGDAPSVIAVWVGGRRVFEKHDVPFCAPAAAGTGEPQAKKKEAAGVP